jgi:hypothetical protein
MWKIDATSNCGDTHVDSSPQSLQNSYCFAGLSCGCGGTVAGFLFDGLLGCAGCADCLGAYSVSPGSRLSEDTMPYRVDGVLRNLGGALPRGLKVSGGCILGNLCVVYQLTR